MKYISSVAAFVIVAALAVSCTTAPDNRYEVVVTNECNEDPCIEVSGEIALVGGEWTTNYNVPLGKTSRYTLPQAGTYVMRWYDTLYRRNRADTFAVTVDTPKYEYKTSRIDPK